MTKSKNLFSRLTSLILSGTLIYSCSMPTFAMDQQTELPEQGVFEERGLAEVIEAVATYTDIDLPVEGQDLEQIKSQSKLMFTKLISKILKNSTLSTASAATIIHLFCPGKEAWGAGIGLGIAAFDAFADIAKSYYEIMHKKNETTV
ncbi:MAG: hypothetical protein LBJ95_02390 [Oscillospiraceae bacterium]|jgi:hypothetical protein|nr:hypothetical protein [Oscillospiraceae bacterium]